MSRKGGYKIIDLKGLDFSSNMVIDGIHESIEDNYGKPLLFSGIVIDGVEKDDVFANAVVNGDGYDVTLYDYLFHISNIDVVSVTPNIINFSFYNEDSLTLKPNKTYHLDYAQEEVTIDMENCLGVMVAEGGIGDIISSMILDGNNYLDLVLKNLQKDVTITTYNNIVMIFANSVEV